MDGEAQSGDCDVGCFHRVGLVVVRGWQRDDLLGYKGLGAIGNHDTNAKLNLKRISIGATIKVYGASGGDVKRSGEGLGFPFRLPHFWRGSPRVPPARPVTSVQQSGPDVVLSWTDAHDLQTSVSVSGVYTNVPRVILGPYTNKLPEIQRFFRPAD